MSTKKTEGRYSEICGATNNRGEPCSLPAGWGTPGSQKGRCRFHGGSSTGPSDTSHLEENDYAKDNPGGGARLNWDKLIIGYEYEQESIPVSEEHIPEGAIGGIELPSESKEVAAHQKRLEEDLVGLDEETNGSSKDQT